MKAVVFERYGGPDILRMKEIERPKPGNNELLVRVKAVSINEWDHSILTANVFANRMMFGLLRPRKMNILGCDVSGVVEDTGKDVEGFIVGDEVFGDLSDDKWGGLAEYVCGSETSFILKSPKMTFEEAAAIPEAGLLALQSYDQHGRVGPGSNVRISGGGGGAGTFAIQIAKHLGAEVTGVDSSVKLDLMRHLGADHVIDFTKEDFTMNGQTYDHIIDVTGNRKLSDYRRALADNGLCSLVGGSTWLMMKAHLFGSKRNKRIALMMYKTNKGLDRMVELFDNDKVKPVIDRCFSLEDTAEAFRFYVSGIFKGKIVIKIDEDL